MTAEIAIMNKGAVALAADSAVTMTVKSGQKIFVSANKLFTLSKYNPVGIMVYGNAVFMGIPWEKIIKIYREKIGDRKHDTLTEYAIEFIEFLDNNKSNLFPELEQEKYLKRTIYGYFNFIIDTIEKKLKSEIERNKKFSLIAVKKVVSEQIDEHYERWEKARNIPTIPKNQNTIIISKFEKIIDNAINEIFEKLPINKRHSNKLKKISSYLFTKFPEGIELPDISGIVIAGFGEKDIFPSLESFLIEGIVVNKLKYVNNITGKIDFDTNASIIPFAQKEMVVTFMEGVDPFYRNMEESYIKQLFNKYAEIIIDNLEKYNNKKKELKDRISSISNNILDDHFNTLKVYRDDKYVSPVLNVVSMLPKDELAAMAESLVNITSFKRKVTTETETVAGPIDVAVISKGDGFIWIKRKHYFDKDLNPYFFNNYYKE